MSSKKIFRVLNFKIFRFFQEEAIFVDKKVTHHLFRVAFPMPPPDCCKVLASTHVMGSEPRGSGATEGTSPAALMLLRFLEKINTFH